MHGLCASSNRCRGDNITLCLWKDAVNVSTGKITTFRRLTRVILIGAITLCYTVFIKWFIQSNTTSIYLFLLLRLLQSALQPLWVTACSTIGEYSQQEGFYRVPLPAARQTPNLEDQWLKRSNSRHQASLTSETTRANPSSGRWNYGRENSENFAESGDFHVTFGFFYMP